MNKLMFGFRRSETLRVLMFFIVSGVVMCFPLRGRADVVTDGSVGHNQSLSGPDFVIPDTLGITTGTNLFHSFQKFGITQDQSATFTGPDTINNVISRVTGGEISNIDGLLRSEVGQADFFFINPSGVVFGENAKVDVPAAFHVSTADALNFKDGSVFSASSPDTSTLTMAPPESFGFLGAQSASIEVNGSLLEFLPGSRVSLTSGDITIQGSVTQDAQLLSDAGKIHLTAMGTTTGYIPIAGILTTDSAGTLTLNLAHVKTSGNGGGHVLIQAGNVDMNAAIIAADNTGSSLADGGVDMVVDGTLTLAHGSCVQTNVFGEGNAGTVEITVGGLLQLLNGAVISSDTGAKGDAGSIKISAGEMILDGQGDMSGISSSVLSDSEANAGSVEITVAGLLQCINSGFVSSLTVGKGDAGSITINAGEMILDGNGQDGRVGIFSDLFNAGGNAGSVEINVDGLLQLLNGAVISSSTWGKSDAGSIKINAGEMFLDGQGDMVAIASIAGRDTEGNAGSVKITVAGLLQLTNGSIISTATGGKGKAGSVSVKAGEIIVDDQGSESGSRIESNTYAGSEGNAGSVEITVDGLLQLLNGAEISSGTKAKGDAGSVSVKAGDMIIDDKGSESFTGITSKANPDSEGNAGSVEITVDGLLQLLNGVEISSSTFAKGDAGSVSVKAGDMIIDDQGSDSLTGITSNANPDSEGNAGSVEITVDGLLQLLNGAEISSSTWSKGNAGSVTVNAETFSLDGNQTGIASAATSSSTGYVGDININAENLALTNEAQVSIKSKQTLSDTSIAEMPQNSINITTQNLHLDQGARITAESTDNVPAGAINLQSDSILVENSSRITTASNDADGGPITLQGNIVFLNDALITTSVNGIAGDGGDITITGVNNDDGREVPLDALVMKGGFIQANTGAADARGGNITINARAVVVDAMGGLQVGGEERQEFQPGQYLNVIQAAAPGGEKGTINITAPDIDISGSLANVGTYFVNPALLATNPCVATTGEPESSLIQGGRGGIPETPDDFSSVSYMGHRLDQIFNEDN